MVPFTLGIFSGVILTVYHHYQFVPVFLSKLSICNCFHLFVCLFVTKYKPVTRY